MCRFSALSSLSPLLLVLLVLLVFLTNDTSGKVTSGEFKLSGVNSEYILGSFAVGGENKWAEFDVVLRSKNLYENDQHLNFVLIPDTVYNVFKEATTCREKMKYVYEKRPIKFDHDAKRNEYQATMFNVEIDQAKFIQKMFYAKHSASRPYYWYFAVTDCTLEEYLQDDRIPKISYTLSVMNVLFRSDEEREKYAIAAGKGDKGELSLSMKMKTAPSSFLTKTHLSADEFRLDRVHSFCMFISGCVITYTTLHIIYVLKKTSSIHMSKFLLLLAASLDLLSSFTELTHLTVYKRNGIGLYTMDAISAHAEACCDSVLILLLLALASGWTLPSDVFKVQQNKTFIQSVIVGISGGGGINSTFFIAGSSITLIHVILAQWGRTYNDNFDSYHDYEHLPGKILMLIRIVLGIFMVAAIINSKNCCTMESLQPFYNKIGVIGTLWFQSLPLVIFLSTSDTLVPVYARMNVVFITCALLQSTFLVMFAVILTKSVSSKIIGSAYHNLSRVSQSEDVLSEGLTGPSSNTAPTPFWKLGKMKVRLD